MKQKINLLQEIPESEMGLLEERIYNFLSSRLFTTERNHGEPLKWSSTIDGYDIQLGLAYTSSSAFAAIWVCNDSLYLDCEQKFKIRGFAMTTSHLAVAVCDNEDEESIYIYI